MHEFLENWQAFRKNRVGFFGLLIVIFFLTVAVLGALVTSGKDPTFNPKIIRLPDKFKAPMSRPSEDLRRLDPQAYPKLGLYIFGTDEYGRDVFARMLSGSKIALSIGFVAVAISIFVGILLGALAGFYGGWVDRVVVRLVDVMLCFPSFFLILTVVAVLPPSILNVMVVIGLTSWMGTCRFVRAEFLSLREQDFVSAARVSGVSSLRIMLRHMLPNALAPVLVSANLEVASAILIESSLSFLGFSVPPPTATWGNILSDGKNYLFDAPHLTFIPGIAIFLTVLAFNLFGEGLRETLNPKLR